MVLNNAYLCDNTSDTQRTQTLRSGLPLSLPAQTTFHQNGAIFPNKSYPGSMQDTLVLE